MGSVKIYFCVPPFEFCDFSRLRGRRSFNQAVCRDFIPPRGQYL
nr:MAG TPA: hypothetical protein [Caudoviricetes sp.]